MCTKPKHNIIASFKVKNGAVAPQKRRPKVNSHKWQASSSDEVSFDHLPHSPHQKRTKHVVREEVTDNHSDEPEAEVIGIDLSDNEVSIRMLQINFITYLMF
jgi:hypothetical protein